MKSTTHKIVTSFLIVGVFTAATLFSAPPRIEACSPGTPCVIADSSNTSLLQLAKQILTEVNTATSAAANVAQKVNTYVLQPLLFVMSGRLIQSLTAGVLAFVAGQANSTGAPQFVQDLRGNLQKVGDTQALAFFAQFGRNSNSPFAASITSSLRSSYLQNTSLAGFWASQKCTLTNFSPNVNSFLAGNWSQGGVGAWFALTTQPQNNPYLLYQTSQAQLASLVANATASRLQELAWGGGFLSWCGPTDKSGNAVSDLAAEAAAQQGQVDEAAAAIARSNGENVVQNAGDPCTQDDGTPGITKTPGSTIKAGLDKVLGSGQDKLVQMGALANEVNGIMGNIATVFQTIDLAKNILSGPNSKGLFGAGVAAAGSSGTNSSQGFVGVTANNVYQNASGSALLDGSDMLDRANRYESAWQITRASIATAETAVNNLKTACASQASVADAALSGPIQAGYDQANAADAAVSSARGLVTKIRTELNNGGGTYTTDLQTLQTMTPTANDVAAAELNSQTNIDPSVSSATAIPTGSLTVIGGTLFDRMSLIANNAIALKNSCAPGSGTPSGGEGGG